MKNIVVLGGGESGVGAAVLAKQKMFAIFLSDQGKIKPKYKKILQKHSIAFEDEGHTTSEIFKADIVIKSPGIPDDLLLINNLRNQGVEVISEIEFAYRFTDATIIAITGSNGKTTVTKMVYHILEQANLSVAMVGNVGDSFAMHLATQPEVDNYVIEVSSFQLDNCVSFKPHISILTNITPDHLDRYDNNFNLYRKAKFKILQNQGQDDFFIYNEDDLAITEFLPKISTNVQLIPFSKKQLKQNIAAFIEQNTIKINLNQQKTFNMSINNLNVKGTHNAQNAMAASTAARLLKIRKQTIRESMESFRGVEHRLEEVKVLNNVNYINDSKATNINATFYALDSMTKPTVWIVGGVDKGNNYQDLLALVNERVKAIVCLGIDNSKIIDAFGKTVDELVETANMADAVLAAQHFSNAGDSVLLSPACASFDLFENYEDRGRQFKECVRKL